MGGRVIQGFFIGAPRAMAAVPARPVQARTAPGPAAPRPGPPMPAFAGPAVAQRSGGAESFAIDPARVGIGSGGGRPLPEAVRGQMEAALGADFSGVRVHAGPQAERIGAIAFTMGNDIYFAPGRFQPETVQGRQLLGHELAHVVQQRAGRVRNPAGAGVAVVQDRVLEAEAERLGHRAAMRPPLQCRPVPVQPKAAPHLAGVPQAAFHDRQAARPGPPVPAFAGGAAQRQAGPLAVTGGAAGSGRPGGGPEAQAKAVQHTPIIQTAKRNKKKDDEDEYIPPQGRKQKRWTFSRNLIDKVIKRTAHLRRYGNKNYRAIWTCPGCRRPIAYRKATKIELVNRNYTSKGKKLHRERALQIDHFPPWAERERALKGRGASDAEIREAHDDVTKLRALCRVCNGSHKYEKKKTVDYESDTDEEGYLTDDDEPENKGFYAPFRRDPPDDGGVGAC